MLSDDLASLEHFAGTARLFPLPNLVLFPTTLQALHIFEPRYRQMTADALGGDRLIAIALLQPGWEADYEGRPAVYPVACLGKIVDHERLPDGRYNLHLRGLSRVRIQHELPDDKLYRSAQVELLADIPVARPGTAERLRRKLREAVTAWLADEESMRGVLTQVLESGLPLGMACDLLSFALPLEAAFKQALLERIDVEDRARLLLRRLQQDLPSDKPEVEPPRFPPDFSKN